MQINRGMFAILLCAAALLLPRADALAQTVVSLTNNYIEFRMGVSGSVQVGNVTYDVAGRFGVLTQTGDPDTDQDDNTQLIYGSDLPKGTANLNYGIWKLKVGASDPVIVGGSTGRWSKTPRAYDPPAPGQGQGKAGPYIEGEWTQGESGGADPVITVRIRVSLVRDQVRFEFNLVNNGSTTQSVGFAMLDDITTQRDQDGLDRSGMPFVPGTGLARTVGFADEYYGRVFTSSNMPEMFECYDDVDNPAVSTRNTLKSHDCVAPDYLAVGEWESLMPLNVWLPEGYTPDPLTPVEDMAALLVWRQSSLYPRSTRKIVTYYGVGAANSAWTRRMGFFRVEQDSAALAVQGPRALQYDTTDVTQSELRPSPFKIKAYVYNLATDPGPYEMENVTAYLFLPKGLELMPGNLARQEIGRVPINSEGTPVEWEVRATGEYSGELEYYVSVRDVSGWQQVVSRKVMVPAIKKGILRSGYQLVSVPFAFNDPSIDHVFGLTPGSFFASRYNGTSYVPATQVRPGEAFWMTVSAVRPGNTMTFQLAADAAITGESSGRQLQEQYVALTTGWNMVGSPFVYPLYLGQLAVYNRSTNTTVSFDDAVAYNWISRTVFWWNQDKSNYEYLRGNDAFLLPYRGYWVRARIPVTLVFRPAIWPGSSVRALPGGF